MDAITQETGCTTMACNHSFHFCCLVNWFSTQYENEQDSSCPNCRRAPSEKEDLPLEDLEDEEDEEDEDEEDYETDDEEYEEDEEDEEEEEEYVPIPINFSLLKLTVTAEEGQRQITIHPDSKDPHTSATKFQAVWRGFQARQFLRAARALTDLGLDA